ncbi:LysR family transcriptional regulator [Vibrio nitrifigilis]|uniref:LysR family transcriptional regulator n=1 Tax=Vibrio nitrifigilis TaxID=2789781 RepID=A0ABS0GL56_9VIBR|nr:LysR family transcriptional regulator [Vibrio nitrifigilis]MBF9003157.1 LysR family transcriptional regulator [Vibrio nitrifigilis]
MYKTSIDQWLVFTTIIETGGFNAAAEKLHRSQSSISYSISKLQEQLGLKLFIQNGRKMRLTAEGERLREEIAPVLKEFGRIESVANMLASGVESRICLLVDSIFPRQLLFKAIHLFNQQYPNTRVELYDMIRLSPSEHVQFDMAICTSTNGLVSGDKIIDIELYPVAHPNHPIFNHQPIHRQELSHHVSVRFQNSHQIQGNEPMRKGEYWLVNTLEAAASAVRNRLAYGWLPMEVIRQDLEQKTMALLQLEDRFKSIIPLYLIAGDNGICGPASAFLKQVIFQVCQNRESLINE